MKANTCMYRKANMNEGLGANNAKKMNAKTFEKKERIDQNNIFLLSVNIYKNSNNHP